MMTKKFAMLAAAGALVLAPAMSHAYDGVLVSCAPTAGVAIPVELSPGLGCSASLNKIGIEADVDNCTADAAAPWATWSAAGYPTKKIASAAIAGTINKATVKVKAKTFGSCNFSGSTVSGGAGGGGKFALLTSAGDKVGSGSFFGTVGSSLATGSALAQGIVTKGDLTASFLTVSVGIDAGAPENSNLVLCNLGYACPPDIVPATILALKTVAGNYFKIGNAQNSDCTAVSEPWACCTGVAAGNC